jgi:hypothetical protein
MSDIFISYASKDRQYAEIVAQALEQRGWRVWWDPKISPGKEWDEVRGEELRVTRCVVVLWSQYSVQSRWVKAETNVGLEREILVPAVIENKVQIPWAFRRIEAAQLVDWLKKQGSVRNQEFDQFVEAIAERIGTAPVGPAVEAKPQRGGQFNLKWLGFALIAAVVGVFAFVLLPVTRETNSVPNKELIQQAQEDVRRKEEARQQAEERKAEEDAGRQAAEQRQAERGRGGAESWGMRIPLTLWAPICHP